MAENTNRFAYIAALNGALFGYNTGIISGALLYIRESFSLSSLLQEVVVSAVLVGAVLAAAGGRLADGLGRRRLLLITAVVFFVGALGMALSPEEWTLIAFRFVAGLAIGVASLIGPLYISEMSPPGSRSGPTPRCPSRPCCSPTSWSRRRRAAAWRTYRSSGAGGSA